MSSGPAAEPQLHRSFIHGFAWTTITKWLTQGITWAGLLVATRLLTPADFGISEMAGLVGLAANLLAEFGLGSAVLQMRQLGTSQLRQINSSAFLCGLSAIAVSWLAAPWASLYFHQPALRDLIFVNSLVFLPMAVQMIPYGLLQRDLDFRRLSLLEAAFSIMQSAALVISALLGAGYWSLTIAIIVGRITAAAMAVYWCPVGYARPRWEEIRAPLRFGLDISISRLGSTVVNAADSIVVGRVLGDSALGAYRLALNLAGAPAEKIGQLIMRVTGPLLARLQDDPHGMRCYFFVISDVLCLTLGPLTIGFVVTAPDLIIAFAGGDRWKGSIEPACWLAAFLGLRSLLTLVQQALTALRETRFLVWISVLSFIVLPPGFYLMAPRGLGAIAAVWLITAPVFFVPQIHRLLRRLEASWFDYLRVLTPSMLSSLIMGLAVWLSAGVLPESWNAWQRLLTRIALGGMIYVALAFAIHRHRLRDYYRIVRGNL